MESNLTHFLKMSNKSFEKLLKKTEELSAHSKNTRKSNYPKRSFETTVLPIICVKQSAKQNRKDIHAYPVYNNKQDLAYDDRDTDFEKKVTDNGSNISYNHNGRSLNNFSKILVTLKLKKETSLRNNFGQDQLPLLKSAIHNYNNNNISYTDNNSNSNNNNYHNISNKINLHSIKRKNIYLPIEFLEYRNEQISSNFDKNQSYLANISDSSVLKKERNSFDVSNMATHVSYQKDNSIVWKNMDKFLNTRSPENPPGTPDEIFMKWKD